MVDYTPVDYDPFAGDPSGSDLARVLAGVGSAAELGTRRVGKTRTRKPTCNNTCRILQSPGKHE